MKITELEIDGFGVWSGLRIEKLSDSLNVLYGPNEAGKSTLLQFIRSMLYGFSPARRRYLPPVHGGRPGGSMDLAGPHGRYRIGRHDTQLDGSPGEQLTLTAPDGTRQGEHFIKVLLSNVDETVFNNVFAVGLREVQELATLSDTEAAEQLYNLTAGLDRVSLVEVLHELETSRNRLLDAAGGTCQVVQLVAEREKLRSDIEELGTINRRYGHLVAERDQLHTEITRLEEEANRIERLARVMDLAIALRDRWSQRAALDDQLSALGPLKTVPEDAIGRLDALNVRIQKHQQRLDQLAQLREEAKREFAELSINEALWRQAARIEALQEQEPWIAQLLGQIAELRNEIAQIELELSAESERLGLTGGLSSLPALSAKAITALRAPSKSLRQCRQRLAESQQAAATAHETVQSLTRQIDSALQARGQRDLTAAMDRAGSLVSQLRRRAQIDDRLEQLARYQTELEERSRRFVDRQMLPMGLLVGLGAVFVIGAVLMVAGLFMQASITASIGVTMGVLGLAGMGAAVGGKMMIERSNAHQLDACQKQLSVLQSQVKQAKDDRDALDAQLPRGGSIESRLPAAEKELAALEELAPLDARRNASRQEAETAVQLAEEATEALKAARRRWRQSLAAIGLPETIQPKQVRRLAQQCDRIAERQRRLAQRRDDLVGRQRELDAISARIVQLAADTGVSVPAAGPVEQLRQLAEAAAQQESTVARRDAIRGEARRNRTARIKHEEAVGRLKHRRRESFIEIGVKDEQEFRQRVLESARGEVLRRQQEAISREIEVTLASQCSEDAIRQQLEGNQPAPLETRRDEIRPRLASVQDQLHGLLEKRGRLNGQLEAIAADRQLAAKQLDLTVVEKRLDDAIGRWQVLATACSVLNMIRTTYERQRQPETLQEASGYLDRLTQGRYRRVWTPLGEHALKVDDAEGNPLPVEVLSRGTREQLFLSLRLALASSYTRRGATLPLILDDVLVNFDADRAKAAAAVLRDFAAAGHQLLVFTCHEHILKLFKSLKLPANRLPSNSEPGRVVIAAEQRIEEKPKREKAPRQPRSKAAVPDKKPSREQSVLKDTREGRAAASDEEDRVESDDEDDSLWEGADNEEPYDDFDDDNAAAA
jgi:uncharacterized protein YhaN